MQKNIVQNIYKKSTNWFKESLSQPRHKCLGGGFINNHNY